MRTADNNGIVSTVVQIAPGSISPEDLAHLLSQLPQWRLKKALSYHFDKDRYLCAESFLLLEKMLRRNFDLSRCPEFSYAPNGKPFLKEYPSIHFNMSHCRRGIACAVALRPVGIDIEEIQYDALLAQTVLNPKERLAVERSPESDVEFTRFWTRKESLLKLSGEGIRDDLRDVLSESPQACFNTECNRDAGYVVSTVFWPWMTNLG